MTKGSHLTLSERIIIEQGLTNGASRTAIARTLGKDKSTIAKEVKKRRKIVKPRSHARNGIKPVFDCIHMEQCGCKNVCREPCEHYQMTHCNRRDKRVGVCNGCDQLRTCKQVHYIYTAKEADEEYRYTLRDAREGVNLTTSQALELGRQIKKLIDQGQSPYAILSNNNLELNICEKTLYNYITEGVFSANGLVDLDLRLKTSRKQPRKKVISKPREDRAYLKNRTYQCFEKYIEEHPAASVVEMDTVYNDETNGPFIQTFLFVECDLIVGFLHQNKTAKAMINGVRMLKERMGSYFSQMVQIILTDRGTEFSGVEEMEALGAKVFYCDPQCAWQKGHVENTHRLLRWVLPKRTNLTQLGLETQNDLDLIFSHINSYKRENLKNKSAYELMEFYYNAEVLRALHIHRVSPDKIILKPDLITKLKGT